MSSERTPPEPALLALKTTRKSTSSRVRRATPRSIEWMRAMRDRYTQACRAHPATGPLDRFQQLERDNADYWRSRVREHDVDVLGGAGRTLEVSSTVRAHVFAGYLQARAELVHE